MLRENSASRKGQPQNSGFVEVPETPDAARQSTPDCDTEIDDFEKQMMERDGRQ